MADIHTRMADYDDPADARTVIELLDCYARDSMGGGKPLDADVRERVVPGLRETEGAFSIIAFEGDAPVGLANCLTGYSTFAARPLVNIHDVVVREECRGKGIGKRLFDPIHEEAHRRDACKVTLEVLSGNHRAKSLYAALGYGDYELDPEKGHALFWQKELT